MFVPSFIEIDQLQIGVAKDYILKSLDADFSRLLIFERLQFQHFKRQYLHQYLSDIDELCIIRKLFQCSFRKMH